MVSRVEYSTEIQKLRIPDLRPIWRHHPTATNTARFYSDAPRKWGVLAFPGADLLDVYGPIEMLFMVATMQYLELTIITPTDEGVIITPGMGNPNGSVYEPVIVGTATMQDEIDIDILVVPGGAAARDPSMTYVDDYLKKKMPDLEYLITICTGAAFAARGGLLEGRRATTNKAAWDTITAHGKDITWVAPARYVIDDNIWSSSGVSLSPNHNDIIQVDLNRADD